MKHSIIVINKVRLFSSLSNKLCLMNYRPQVLFLQMIVRGGVNIKILHLISWYRHKKWMRNASHAILTVCCIHNSLVVPVCMINPNTPSLSNFLLFF